MSKAEYDTNCYTCHLRIDVGDTIEDMGDHYLCEYCVPTQAVL